MSTLSRSAALFERAQKTIPGGMNSPVRAFRSVGSTLRFIIKVAGPYLQDADGTCYIDYVGSWGPMIVGHAHPDVVCAVQNMAANNFSSGAPIEAEVVMAEEICKLVPSIEQVWLVSSGTEAIMSALRLARGFTGCGLIIKFEGCCHGHADSLLVKAGSGLLTLVDTTQNAFSFAGVPEDVVKHTMVLPYNDVTALCEAFARHGREIAAVIVGPVAGSMSLVRGSNEFHQVMRALCTEHGAVLIFDEVMTGFRVALGCVQALYRIKPDLTRPGKVIGGGMPAAAFGGHRDTMGFLASLGNVYQVGTLPGDPLAVVADLTALWLIAVEGFHDRPAVQTRKSVDGLVEIAHEVGVPFAADNVGGMFGIYFRESVPTNFAEVTESDVGRFSAFLHAMLDQGAYLAPSALEVGFVSATHDGAILDVTFEAARKAFKSI